MGGGGTDLPFYADEHGASLLSAAIDKFIYVTVSKRLQGDIKLNYSETEVVKTVDDIKHPLLREALKLVGIDEGIEIHSSAELPSGTGLGSSHVFLVALLNALYSFKGEVVSRYKLAEDASKITMEILKEPCGKQDQYASAFGGLNHFKISTNGRVTVTPVNISHENLKTLSKNLMLFYTGFSRMGNEVLGDQKKKAQTQEEIFAYYHEIKKIGEESLKCLEKGDLRRFGEWMNIHWELKRKISDKMSNPTINKWYDLALSNGAIGGKLIGAGGGGFLMLYVDKNHDKIINLMTKEGLTHTEFSFDYDGARIVYRA
jgi:D-glycero-alpha-D-manno-heptose-7-phosphate kinase